MYGGVVNYVRGGLKLCIRGFGTVVAVGGFIASPPRDAEVDEREDDEWWKKWGGDDVILTSSDDEDADEES